MPRIILAGPSQRAYATESIKAAPHKSLVRILKPKRTDVQNDKMWVMLRDISKARPEGRLWTPDSWKGALMHSAGHQMQFVEGLDGSGPLPLGYRSSQLTVAQMSDLITVIYEYGDRHGVQWRESERSGFMPNE